METKPRPKNWLLIKFREYHTYIGLGAGLLIVMAGLTGIFLNHKDLFLGKEKHDMEMEGGISVTLLKSLPVTFEQALVRGTETLGNETPIEHIQLKNEHGTLYYKVKAMEIEDSPPREVLVDARTGEVTHKDGYLMHDMKDGQTAASGVNWGKFFLDLHTGKLAGTPGKLVMDVTAIILTLLTLSGIYLWWVPKMRKKESQRIAAAKAVRT
jgi:hypothetical protein